MSDTPKNASQDRILTLDIGGSKIKGTILNAEGDLLQEYAKVDTPDNATPERVLEAIKYLVAGFDHYDKISVGFPGYVKKGIVFTAPNLATDSWGGVNLNKLISDALQKPVRIANDADLQGLAVVSGNGLEIVITLGTGFGTAILKDGNLLPHVELAHHAITKNKTYDDYVGNEALQQKGREKWNRRMKKIIDMLKIVFNYDRLYIGGGNAKELTLDLDTSIELITNKDGIKGGARLWELDENLFMKTNQG
jgi:polyphosphate glucokinase